MAAGLPPKNRTLKPRSALRLPSPTDHFLAVAAAFVEALKKSK
jgi:hypothetical protein